MVYYLNIINIFNRKIIQRNFTFLEISIFKSLSFSISLKILGLYSYFNPYKNLDP